MYKIKNGGRILTCIGCKLIHKMEYIIILITCIVTIILVRFGFDIKSKDMKKVKEIGYDKELNDITNKLPENKEVCKEILNELENKNVEIEESENKEDKLTYYSIVGNKIIIANIKDTFTRIQTIAHECIHSIQDKKMLWFNFIFSNIYIIYFGIMLILTITKVIKNPMIQIVILTLLGFIYYMVRSYLETDAMTKAPFIAEKYIRKTNKLSDKEVEKVIENFDILNKIGILMTNFQLMTSVIIKIIIYCVISLIIINT